MQFQAMNSPLSVVFLFSFQRQSGLGHPGRGILGSTFSVEFCRPGIVLGLVPKTSGKRSLGSRRGQICSALGWLTALASAGSPGWGGGVGGMRWASLAHRIEKHKPGVCFSDLNVHMNHPGV